MTTNESLPQTAEYRCPGEKHPISRAVHLGRLAAFYPGCRQCPHRDDTGTLSTRQVAQLAETSRQTRPRPLFHDEGAGGVYLNDLTPTAARNIAAAFGMMLKDEGREERGEGRGNTNGWGDSCTVTPATRHNAGVTVQLSPQQAIPFPSIVLAGDGRPLVAELVAAVGEGLRFSGCNVIDIGPATAACLAFAVAHLQAAGGLLVGNPGGDPHTVGLKFWAAGPQPLSAGGSLEPLVERAEAGVSRPARSVGAIHRFQADTPYLAWMAEYYHALRPLRIVVRSASRPAVGYLQRLMAAVACNVIPCQTARHDLPAQIHADAAHLVVCIDDDGESCRVLDEQGREVPAERLLLFLIQHVGFDTKPVFGRAKLPLSRPSDSAADGSAGASPSPSVVLEAGTSPTLIERLERLGVSIAMSNPRRADMSCAMQEHGAIFGGGPSGRFWHAEAGFPLSDALMTVTRLLLLLSRSDAPFSVVLDREAAWV